jgi:hypothetical protein
MAQILLIGDSQAGNPGAAAKRILEAAGHTVTQVHNDGKSPVAYVNTPSLWSQYTSLAAAADLVVLIFGHNSPAGAATRNALVRMKNGVRPPVFMSGPPMYPNADDQQQGTALRTQNMGIFGTRYIDAWPSTPVTLPRDAPGWHLTPTAAQGWGQAIADAATYALAHGVAIARPGPR